MKKSIFTEDGKYTFSDYFSIPALIKDIVSELGYSFYSIAYVALDQYEETI